MKKFLAIVAIAAFMTSCNDSASTTETKPTDSAAVAPTPAPTDSAAVEHHADSTAAPAADSSKMEAK